MANKIIVEGIKNQKIHTPCYVLDKNTLISHVKRIVDMVDEIAGEKVNLCYAMKANALITKYLSEVVSHIEVCSPGELEICKNYCVPGRKIIYSGVNKSLENIEDAIDYGVDIITLESIRQYDFVKIAIKQRAKTIRVLPRLSSGAQFGMSKTDLEYVVNDSSTEDSIEVIGIHYFTGTQKKSVEKDYAEISEICSYIEKMHSQYGLEIQLFEYGAGLKVPYFEGDDFERVYDDFRGLINYIVSLDLPFTVGIELGRFFAFSCMRYLTSIDDIKKVDETNICIVDGGIHHINYYGQNMAMRIPIIEHIRLRESDNGLYNNPEDQDLYWKICGSLCTFSDILVRKIKLYDPQIGDILVFNNSGAYSITEAPALFLSRNMPLVYELSESNELRLIRDRYETYRFNC